jgi:hypothetical protein
MANKARLLKIEKPVRGQDVSSDPCELNPKADYLSGAGVSIGDSDEHLIELDGNGNFSFKDSSSPSGMSLLSRVRQCVIDAPIPTSGNTFTQVGSRFIWVNSRNTKLKAGVVMFKATVSSPPNLELRVVDSVTTTVLGTTAPISADGIYILSFDLPTADTLIEIQIRQTLLGGTSPTVESVTFEIEA